MNQLIINCFLRRFETNGNVLSISHLSMSFHLIYLLNYQNIYIHFVSDYIVIVAVDLISNLYFQNNLNIDDNVINDDQSLNLFPSSSSGRLDFSLFVPGSPSRSSSKALLSSQGLFLA
ncbi:hypothetical protein DERP_005137 [Dermatophagoides pteronyssinus]|uniref:Uncharacterized protein n=1 Tax=Dermatophagoides pteronyssinus TaxID=6956 RepID=A0ABQ8JTG6_DERPT|nr:hypothetical protein DERP_005137 [Dermatophagoides pteronyssinus]